MPLVNITLLEGRTKEQKKALLAAVTEAVEDSIGASRAAIKVWLTEVPRDEFMSAGTLASDAG